jgi:hypothetical protein
MYAVEIGDMWILFSYSTPVAFARTNGRGTQVARYRREPISSTTGRHFSHACAVKWPQLDEPEFMSELGANMAAALQDIAKDYDVVGAARGHRDLLFEMLKLLGSIAQVEWTDAKALNEAVGLARMEMFGRVAELRGEDGKRPKRLVSRIKRLIKKEQDGQRTEEAEQKASPAAKAGARVLRSRSAAR